MAESLEATNEACDGIYLSFHVEAGGRYGNPSVIAKVLYKLVANVNYEVFIVHICIV